MQEYIDAACLLTEARMMWNDFRCAYLLLEGTSDKTFFSALMREHPNVQFRVVQGWKNVYNTISKAEQENFSYVAGIIDRDYHAVLGDEVKPTSQLIFTDTNDIEMMLVDSSSFEKFLVVCGSDKKLKDIPDKRGLVMSAAFPIGVIRYLSLKNKYNFCFEGLEHKNYICKQDLSVDKKRLIDIVLNRTRSNGTQVTVSTEELFTNLNAIMEKSLPSQFCNGHDVLDVVCIAMTKLFATNDANTYCQENIFNYLLMGYTEDEFQSTYLYGSLTKWMDTLIC